MLNGEEIKPVAIAIIELRLSEGISQSVSQQKNLLNKKFFKFHNNLMQQFRVDLKTFLVCLTNTPKLSESKYQAGFGEIILGQNPHTFMIPIYSTTVLYDTC